MLEHEATRHFLRLPLLFRTETALEQIADHPELWDRHSARRTPAGSPHAQMTDIWLRYRANEELTSPSRYAEPHLSVFYPAWRDLPALHHMVHLTMAELQAVQLGGVLITRIPVGCRILPHHDRGTWHAEFYNSKVYVPLQGDDGCVNICEDEHVSMRPGEPWLFDNLRIHSVENNGAIDRITLIICTRTES